MPTTHPTTFVAAVPLAATAAYGLGPFPANGGPVHPTELGPTRHGLVIAIQTTGRIGSQLLAALSMARGSMSEDDLAFETAAADPDELIAAADRLVAAGLVERTGGDNGDHVRGLRLSEAAAGELGVYGTSFGDQHAITSDTLAQICRRLGITAPARKHERVEAVAAVFADPDARASILGRLSAPARRMLEAIAEWNGPGEVPCSAVGASSYDLHLAEVSRYSYWPRRGSGEETPPLAELTDHGIVGVAPLDGVLWIWREAWPILERPLFRSWPSAPRPATAPVTETGLRLPPLVTITERALQHWDLSPPPVLKNGERRFSKTVVRATAKALSTEPETVELIAGTAISLGLLLANVASTSGRGRKRTVDKVWLADPDLRSAWSTSPATTRWLRMVAEWTNPGTLVPPEVVANRHLLLWELASLPDGVGWCDDAEVASWFEHHYAPVAEAEAISRSLADLRALGVVTATGPAALTELGRLALRDPGAVASTDLGSADSAVVQADHTVVCPPDLDADLALRLGEIATLESDAGARIYRLDEASITAAVQGGDSAAAICEFLESLSSVPVADTVHKLVEDAAGRAERVKVLSATTVVVTTDPADLTVATRLKAAKLTAVSPTVAISGLAPDKVRQALDRKGLAPLLVTSETASQPRRSADEADQLEREANAHRRIAERHGHRGTADHVAALEAAAAAKRDPSLRLEVNGPLAVTPELVGSVTEP